jgi:hypothetical protein
MTFWGPRLGTVGAKRLALYVWATYLMKPWTVLTFVVLAIAAKQRDPVTVGLGIAVVAIGILGLIVMFLTPIAVRKAASRALGVKITTKNYPPRDDREYREWCARNRLRPYTAENAIGVNKS